MSYIVSGKLLTTFHLANEMVCFLQLIFNLPENECFENSQSLRLLQKFEFLKKLWCCVGGRLKQKFILSNELIKVEWPP